MSFYTNVIQQNGRIYTRGYDDGKQYFSKLKYKPSLWVDGPGEYTSLRDGKSLTKKTFDSISEASQWKRETVKEIFGDFQNSYKYISETFDSEVEYSTDNIRVLNFDIECDAPPEGGFPYPEKANGEINAITVEYNNNYYSFGCGDYTPKNENSKYIKCKDEVDLLTKFVDLWTFISPDAITGWNIEFFDIPYIVNRITKVISASMASKLSPWGVVKETKLKSMYGREQQTYDIAGISTLDYVALYKKFTYGSRESYSLNNISFEELGEKKLDYSEYDNIFNLAEKNYELFIDYNIKDVELVRRLDDKLRLFDLVYMIAYKAKCNYTDVLGTLKVWDVISYNHLLSKNIIIPPKTNDITRDFVGGYVKESIAGKHKWVMSFDLTSLYPHLIMQYNISPETLKRKIQDITVDTLLEKSVDTSELLTDNETLTANGVVFDTEKLGFIPELMEIYFKERKEAKNTMFKTSDKAMKLKLHTKQMALKILLNSLYGALGNQYFRHFDVNMAEAITTSGQLSIRWIERAMNKYMNKINSTDSIDYVVAMDTDSIYVTFESIVQKIMPNSSIPEITDTLDKIGSEQIQPFIDNSYKELSEYLHTYSQSMHMDRENIADTSVFFAKKRYIMNVLDSEGDRYDEPKIKMMGIEAIKSSTPSVCRTALKEFIKIILNGTEGEAQTFYKDFKQKFKDADYVDISFPRSANNLKKFYDSTTLFSKGTPIHVRGSLLYNFAIEQLGLKNKYNYIEDGTKIKFCYLKMPNPMKSNVIAVPTVLPPELELAEYIDYDLQFEKAFLQPVENMLKVIGWNPEKRNTLESLFV